MKIINVTPHAVRFQGDAHVFPENPESTTPCARCGAWYDEATEVPCIYEIPPCGAVISARPVEEKVGWKLTCGAYSPSECPEGHGHCDGCAFAVELVRTRFEATPEAGAELSRLERENPGAVIVGSIIAAQAFPGRVFALVPVEGFERVPPAEKRMRDDKFTVFS